MRPILLISSVALFALAACGESVDQHNAALEGGEPGYTLEVRAGDAAQIFLVTAPDGRTVAGRAAGGVSALLDTQAMGALAPLDLRAPAGEETVAIRFPGFELSVAGDPDGDGVGQGDATVNIQVAGKERVQVQARDGGDGGDDHANVRISGADEAAARDFIAKADDLSPAVQAQMLAALGLE